MTESGARSCQHGAHSGWALRHRLVGLFAAATLVACSGTIGEDTAAVPTSTMRPDEPLVVTEGTGTVVAAPVPTFSEAEPQPFLADGAVRTHVTETGYTLTTLGCLADLSAVSLDTALAGEMGPLLGWDNAHVYPLGTGRFLWILHDAFFNYTGDATTLDKAVAVHNAAMLQDGTCLTILHRGDTAGPVDFEVGDGATYDRWFWPLGGELHDGRLQVLWSETVSVPMEGRVHTDGLARQPRGVWLATYDATTLERMSFEPAPDPDGAPQYGVAVASDATHTYLFGNSNLFDLKPEGGYFGPDHSATRMYLGRVPRGRLDMMPEYWDGTGWTPERQRAAVISERFAVENTMQPRYIDDRWVAITKPDGFSGSSIVIDVADQPWGPWSTAYDSVHMMRRPEPGLSYQPILLPWRDLDGGLIGVISETGTPWAAAVADPSLYRLHVVSYEWPHA